MNDLEIKTFKYSNNVFYVTIKYFEKLNRAPIKILNHKTNKDKIFLFESETDNEKTFTCDNLKLIIRKYKN